MNDVINMLKEWNLDINAVRERMYQAPTPRERERWHALWLLARGWSAAKVAQALERDPHTIGDWVDNFRRERPQGITFEQSGGFPPHPQRYPASSTYSGSEKVASGVLE